MNDNNEEMNEDKDNKANLDKDDEDIIDDTNMFPSNKDKEDNIIEDVYKIKNIPLIPHSEPPRYSSFHDSSRFPKHERSSSESDSSESNEQPIKKKVKEISEFKKQLIKAQKEKKIKIYK